MNKSQKTPLIDSLRDIPANYRAEWPSQWGEGGRAIGNTMSPVGLLMHEAANEIVRLTAENRKIMDELIRQQSELAESEDPAVLLAKPFAGIRGCGDHGCLIEKPEGMGTNGGCRCHLDRHKASMIVQRLAFLRRQTEEK